MKKIMFALFLLISCMAGYRIYWINARYPSPEVWTGELHDSVQAGNYTITFSGWQWGDGTLLQELCLDFRLILDEDGNEYPAERERVGLVTLSVTKNAQDDTFLDLTSIAFESGAWGNQFDMELMYLLNPQLERLRLQMEEGESREIIFPMTMLDTQFAEKDWERIDEKPFYVVLEYYPEKVQFRCGK